MRWVQVILSITPQELHIFLSHRFIKNPTDKNKTPLSITTLNTYLINTLLIFSLLVKYFFCLFCSLLIKSFFPFSLQFLLCFYFLNFFFSLNITFLIPVLQNVQAKIFIARAANGIRQLNEEREWYYKHSKKSSLKDGFGIRVFVLPGK